MTRRFHNWTPIRVYWRDGQPFVDWCYLGDERFTAPFFNHTIDDLLRQPFNLLFRHQTPLEFLGELYEQNPGLAPTGFIFHMSRCGSTLAAQMLASVAQNIVLSEPPPIDSILRSNFMSAPVTDEQRIERLKWIVGALGQKRLDEKYYFIKFDSWSTLDLELIKLAFPEVPWIFLYRDPVEVIVSQMRQRGAQAIPGVIGQMLPGFEMGEILEMFPEEYCARVLAQICQTAINCHSTSSALMINYKRLPEAVTSVIIKHFRAEFAPEEIESMKHAGQFNAKDPKFVFAPDGEAKRKQASEAALRAAEKWVNPLYEELEKISQLNL